MKTLILTQKGSKYRQIFKSYIKENQVELKSELEFGNVEVIKSFDNREFTITAQVLYRDDKWLKKSKTKTNLLSAQIIQISREIPI
jgi:hypothetical protein